jgi:hypothetical protein
MAPIEWYSQDPIFRNSGGALISRPSGRYSGTALNVNGIAWGPIFRNCPSVNGRLSAQYSGTALNGRPGVRYAGMALEMG